MNDNDIPILKKSYELYKVFHEYRKVVPKTDRFTIYERSENLILDLIEAIIQAGYGGKENKTQTLERASVKLARGVNRGVWGDAPRVPPAS